MQIKIIEKEIYINYTNLPIFLSFTPWDIGWKKGSQFQSDLWKK